MLRLAEPRLLSAFALEPPLAPPNALPEEEERLAEGLAFACEEPGFACEELALDDGLGRLAEEPVDGRAPALPEEGEARFAVLACGEGPLPPEP